MSTTRSPEATPMTAEEFVRWSQAQQEGERYELVDGFPVRLRAETVSHAERKAAVWLALRNALRQSGADCRAFTDGVSVRVAPDRVREPDALVNCGPYEPGDLTVPNPVVVVEVVSPSSALTDNGRKLIDYFALPSILHYLIVYAEEGRVVHHRRADAAGQIFTAILGRDADLLLDPPGITLPVEAFWDD